MSTEIDKSSLLGRKRQRCNSWRKRCRSFGRGQWTENSSSGSSKGMAHFFVLLVSVLAITSLDSFLINYGATSFVIQSIHSGTRRVHMPTKQRIKEIVSPRDRTCSLQSHIGLDDPYEEPLQDARELVPVRITEVRPRGIHVVGSNGDINHLIPMTKGQKITNHNPDKVVVAGDWILVEKGRVGSSIDDAYDDVDEYDDDIDEYYDNNHERDSRDDDLTLKIKTILKRKSAIKRRAPGRNTRKKQLIAANLDTVFVVSSCNQDFNVARLERYIAMVLEADHVEPVIVLTKKDLLEDDDFDMEDDDIDDIDDDMEMDLNDDDNLELEIGEEEDDYDDEFGDDMDGASWLLDYYQEQAGSIAGGKIPVVCLDARNEEEVNEILQPWLGEGQTIAFVGSSGVGKSTLVNTLCGHEVAPTGAIHTDSGQGRHTTTRRQLHFLKNSYTEDWTKSCAILDTPGLRELQLVDASQGLDLVFADIVELTHKCRFNDCKHSGEPGCAIEEAVETGILDVDRLARWEKLVAEDKANTREVEEGQIERERKKNRRAKTKTKSSSSRSKSRRELQERAIAEVDDDIARKKQPRSNTKAKRLPKARAIPAKDSDQEHFDNSSSGTSRQTKRKAIPPRTIPKPKAIQDDMGNFVIDRAEVNDYIARTRQPRSNINRKRLPKTRADTALGSHSRRQVLTGVAANLLVGLAGPSIANAGEVGAAINRAITKSDLGISVRTSVVKGAQLADKIDGQWEKFSDKYGLGSERTKQIGRRPKDKPIPDPLPLNIDVAQKILNVSDKVFLDLMPSISLEKLTARIEKIAKSTKASFERSGVILPTNNDGSSETTELLRFQTAPQYNFVVYAHFKAYSELILEMGSSVNFTTFRTDFERGVGQQLIEVLQLVDTKQGDQSDSALKSRLLAALKKTDTFSRRLRDLGLVANVDRNSIESSDDLQDFVDDALADLTVTVSVDGDVTLQSQILLQEQGYRLYPNFNRFVVNEIFREAMDSGAGNGNRKVSVIDYYFDTNYNSDPDKFEVKQVLLSVSIE